VNSDALALKRQGSPSNSFLPGVEGVSMEEVKNHSEKSQKYKIDCKGGTRCKTHTPKENTKYHLHKLRAGKDKNSISISILLAKNDSSGCILVTPYYQIL